MTAVADSPWTRQRGNRAARLARASALAGVHAKTVAADAVVALLEALIEPGDRVCLEGDNQKQADFLARALTQVSPARVHDLHMVQSVLSLPEHLDLFELGIASRLDFSFSGPQATRLAQLLGQGKLQIGAIHTYLELFGRYFIDLTPKVSLIAAQAADAQGNLYTGPNTEDTPAIVEATAFKSGIVVAQVNEIVDKLPRVDIPADWVDFVVRAAEPAFIEPLFTRDPAQISEIQVLMAMMAVKGIYAEYGVQSLNHGIGFDTAAIELLLPTYGERLGLKGKICRHWALNPHPALIPPSRPAGSSRCTRSAPSWAWRTTSARGPTCSSPAPTAACAATARSARPPATTRATCSSAPRCRWTCRATAPPPRWAASPASAARPTWAPTPAGAATRATPG
jgi:malonate decarboxylase alpha subunit